MLCASVRAALLVAAWGLCAVVATVLESLPSSDANAKRTWRRARNASRWSAATAPRARGAFGRDLLPWLTTNGTRSLLKYRGVVNEGRLDLLGCAWLPSWVALAKALWAALQARRPLGQDAELVALAEALLQPYDHMPRDDFRQYSSDFHAQLVGDLDTPSPNGFCFAGYQAACFVRVLRLEEERRATGNQALNSVIETNAEYCASLFGREASLDFMTSTGWPIELLDFEVHMRETPDPAYTKRRQSDLLLGVDTYGQFAQRMVLRPSSALRPTSVDPQGVSSQLAARAGGRTLRRSILVASVDGGHCALWIEPVVTLRELFPGLVSILLVSYKSAGDCKGLLGPETLVGEEVYDDISIEREERVLRKADILVCQWISGTAKLREFYSKPVIGYVGFYPLNDVSVGKYHSWSEPVEHFWERFESLLDCDVHGGGGRGRGRGRQNSGPPQDGGPPCALVWEEPQLAAAAHWQTGALLPSVRPLSLYAAKQARHNPLSADPNVLVINRGRLVRDQTFTQVVRAMSSRDYPYTFVNQEKGMSFADMAKHRAVVLLPWDLNLVMYHDLYALELPMFLPDRASLHHLAFSYFARYKRSKVDSNQQPWSETRPGRGEPPHPYSPFELEFLENREYWVGFTEYVRTPNVGRFSSVPELLLQVMELNGQRVVAGMHAHNLRSKRDSRAFWLRVLSEFERLAPPRRPPRPTSVLHFTTRYGDLCWKNNVGVKASCCGDPDSKCFDDFWTRARCCEIGLRLSALDDAECGEPLVGSLSSPIFGRPWIQEVPSAEEPFVFLWDEKCGGSNFMLWLKHSVQALGKLEQSFMFTAPGHPVAIGTPFFLKSWPRERREKLHVITGQFDWRLLHQGIGCRTRKRIRTIVLIRNPIDRFVSYYLERTNKRFEHEVTGNRSIELWTPTELRQYLDAIRRDRMSYTGEETGLFCNFENLLCLDRLRTRSSALPLLKQVRPRAAKEKFYFRYNGGPQDRLAWMLDPERGDPRLGKWRLRRTIVALQEEDPDGFRRVLGWHFPWIKEVREPFLSSSVKPPDNWIRLNPSSKATRSKLPQFARDMIAEFNSRDMQLYRAARRQFQRQLRRIESASAALGLQQPRRPDVYFVPATAVEESVVAALNHTVTFKIHEGLSRFMMR